jgi:cadherin 5 type 2 (VE-cadherin)
MMNVISAPDPPSNLSVAVRSGKQAIITWSPPLQGNFSSFKLRILSLSDLQNSYMNRTISVTDDSFQHQLRDLTPGVTYQIQAYTIFDNKESVAYTSRNFTTSECFLSSLINKMVKFSCFCVFFV